ncbi:unnamed protein product, partial [Rotaria sp. Silwood2]
MFDVESVEGALRLCQDAYFCNLELINSWLQYINHAFLSRFADHAALLIAGVEGETTFAAAKICIRLLSDSCDWFRHRAYANLGTCVLFSSKLSHENFCELIQIWLDLHTNVVYLKLKPFSKLNLHIDCSTHTEILFQLERKRIWFREKQVAGHHFVTVGNSLIKFTRENSHDSLLTKSFRWNFNELIGPCLDAVENLCLTHGKTDCLPKWEVHYVVHCLFIMASNSFRRKSSINSSNAISLLDGDS